MSYSHRKLQKWALGYEKKQGVIRCPQRLLNDEKRKRNAERKPKDREAVGYGDNVIRDAWDQADSGKAFAAALEAKGYHLAIGNRGRIVIVKAHGKIVNPIRELPGVRAKQFQARLADVDLSRLPDAEKVKAYVTRHKKAQYAKEMQASRKFDSWSSKLRQETKDRHTAECRKLRDKHRAQLKTKKAEAAKYYKLRSQKAAINKLAASLKRPSLWSKLTRKDHKDRKQLRAMIQTYRSAQGRAKEQVGALAAKHVAAVQQMQDRHDLEKQQVNDTIAIRKPEMYRAPAKKKAAGKSKPIIVPTPQKKKSTSRSNKQDQEQDRPKYTPRKRPRRGRGRGEDDGRGRDRGR